MSLSKYVAKRDFTKTAEPKAGKTKQTGSLTFVIQKHDASRLHYDFRLEMDGVLKSWAVPKGPSTDPKTKRLAMMVEDHPYDYRNFEGLIPKGEYGGGTVIVWDEGTYEPIEPIKGKKAQEKHLLKQLKTGSLKIKLYGEKLEGEFALVKTQGMGDNAWLMIKHNDEYASTKDVTKQDESVLSGKTIEDVGKGSDKVWKNGHEESVKQPESNIPIGMKPMLATLVNEPFDDPDWVYEVKWDGYRALGFVKKGDVELLSRNNKSFNEKFYPIYQLLKEWKISAVVDGEILVLNEKGISNFGHLQNWRSEADGDLVYYVFDLLWYEGKDLMDLPLNERQALLKEVLPVDDDRIRLSKVFNASGIDFFNAAQKMGLEGIIAKKSDSVYVADYRSKEWLKIKVHKRQEVVIAGYTKNEDTSKQFSSLLLGVYEDGALQYAGKVGTGFSDKVQKEMIAQFKPLVTSESPFKTLPDVNKPSRFRPSPPKAKATWLKPELVCEVAFSEVTSDGVFRHPSFQAMRVDKNAKEVVREVAVPTEAAIEEVESGLEDAAHDQSDENVQQEHKGQRNQKVHPDEMVCPAKDKGRKTLLNPKDETQVRKLKGHELKFTHLSKIYWPEDKVTKRDMFNYYYQAAEYIMPYLKDRPMSLNRFPNGIHGPSFYQKDVKGKAPDWVKTFPYTNGEGEKKEYLVGTDEASLLWMASLGCIEMNPWFSRVQSEDNPDYCVIDLDPDKNTFDQVIEAALEVKKVLDALDVPSFCKTSGSTGMHIYIPMAAKYTYDQSQLFARLIVNLVHEQLPDFTTLERSISQRHGKMYLDFLQNRPGATIAGPYSLRPKPGATISMPLHWDEVKPGLTMKHFTIFNAIDRLKAEGDLFKGVLGKGIDLEKTIKKSKSIFN
ncbi:DNA ligase D [Pedobacter hartonius]|uniref:DNA ligase (ATP) n=1 Tax=Pedobacter hartonius TaxID=425514 RepID=A0A1H4H9L7_9SPHI|nr:DNA ligase D [Pedobacter hartonius]SEB18489.1 bifunctional non-homologous end joining protein LigD [Pedobacter hartonius]